MSFIARNNQKQSCRLKSPRWCNAPACGKASALTPPQLISPSVAAVGDEHTCSSWAWGKWLVAGAGTEILAHTEHSGRPSSMMPSGPSAAHSEPWLDLIKSNRWQMGAPAHSYDRWWEQLLFDLLQSAERRGRTTKKQNKPKIKKYIITLLHLCLWCQPVKMRTCKNCWRCRVWKHFTSVT